MQLTDRVTTAEDVVAREVAGETVLLNLASGTYFGLNAVGGRIWQWFDSGSCSLAEVSEKLQLEFEVDAAEAEADVLALAGNLVEHGLIELHA
jgi:hypothetical protein